AGPMLVVAVAGIDENRQTSRADQVAVKADDERIRLGIDQPWSEHRLVVFDHRVVRRGQEVAGLEQVTIDLADSIDARSTKHFGPHSHPSAVEHQSITDATGA